MRHGASQLPHLILEGLAARYLLATMVTVQSMPSIRPTGAFLGQLLDPMGNPITNPGLWSLSFREAGNGFDPNALFFDAGINGEVGGLFGEIQVAPSSVPAPGSRCRLSRPDLCERWSSRLGGAAAEDHRAPPRGAA